MEKYIYSGQKKLRCGYTTGTCAASAAKASAMLLLSGQIPSEVMLKLPSGEQITIEVSSVLKNEATAVSSVVKDSGDDPDVTNGIIIFAEVSLSSEGIEILGGEGIGTVTKPGLDQPVGAAAINSVPRRMIAQAVTETAEKYGYTGGFRIVISAPGGEELAKKTFNPRMGIEGGISIIGTTGIVEPMSQRALVETIRAEASMRRAAGHEYLLLTVGNYSEDFIKLKNGTLADRAVTCSNYIGEALDIAVSLGFKGVLLVGHIGKLVKLGSGIMNTHSSYADGRMETLIACGVLAGAESGVLAGLAGCVTTDAAIEMLEEHGAADKTLRVLTERVGYYLDCRVRSSIETGAVIFSQKQGLELMTSRASELMEHISEE